MHEFEIIQRFFNSKFVQRKDVIQGIGDDAAILQPPAGQQLVVTTDSLILGQHFPQQTLPFDIGYKALAVNLSDLAAMGAQPAWILLALTLPDVDKLWLKEFSKGFFSLANRHQCQLVGGDMTRGPLSITVQIMGWVPAGRALRRDGAKEGDYIYVTGKLGDAGLALSYLNDKKAYSFTKNQIDAILMRLNRPEPRVEVGIALQNIANSAIDISDGLAADLKHILLASSVGAEVNLDQLPLSSALMTLPLSQVLAFALSAGDDYELCFTVSPEKNDTLKNIFRKLDCNYTPIGRIIKGDNLIFHGKEASDFKLTKLGFQHF